MNWPQRFKPDLRHGSCVLVLLVMTMGLAVFAKHGFVRYRFMKTEKPLAGKEIEELEPGEQIWLEVTVVAPLVSERTPWFVEDHVYGCREAWVDDDNDEGSWGEVDWYHPIFWGEVDDIPVQLILDWDCPDGEYDELEHEGSRYLGYKKGQTVSILGEVGFVNEQVVVTAESHRGGSAEEHRHDVLFGFLLRLFCSGLSFLCMAYLLWMSLTGLTKRTHWKSYALRQKLEISRDRFWSLGVMHGWIRGREVEIRRRKGLGDGSLLPSDMTLMIPLKPMMEPYRLRRQLKIEGIFGVFGGEAEIGVDSLDDQFALKGVDVERWRALVGDVQVRDRLLELRQNRVQIRIDQGWIELSWPGLDVKVLDLVMNRAISLVNRMEHVEGRGWQRAAKALSRSFEIDEESRWKIEDSDAELPWVLCYARTEQGWHQTRFTLDLPETVSAHWTIAVSGQGSKIRTGDPILDDQLFIAGLESGEVATLIEQNRATEILLAAVRAHDLALTGGQIILRSPGLLSEPIEMIRDAKRLARLLIRVSR